MREVINFLEKEFSGWTNAEKYMIPLLFLTIIAASLYMNDSLIATFQAVFSLSYTIMAGKGKISCYVFGIFGTLCYSYLSLKNALYGNLLLNMGYFLPMEIAGIFAWKNRLQKNNNEIIRTRLTNKERVILSVNMILASIILAFVLKYLNDHYPVLDSIATIFSMFAMYLTLKRCIEQWILWTFVNITSILMWLMIFMSGSHTFATMLIWCIHLCLGIYFFYKWKKVLAAQNV